MEILFILYLLLSIFAIPATRYLLTSSPEGKVAPIFLVVGYVLAPVILAIAAIKWLFTARI